MMNWTKTIQEVEKYIGRPIEADFQYGTIYSNVSLAEIPIESDFGQKLIEFGWIVASNQTWCKIL